MLLKKTGIIVSSTGTTRTSVPVREHPLYGTDGVDTSNAAAAAVTAVANYAASATAVPTTVSGIQSEQVSRLVRCGTLQALQGSPMGSIVYRPRPHQ
jgi:hypothetical protein